MDSEIQTVFDKYRDLNLDRVAEVIDTHTVAPDGSNISTIVSVVMEALAHLAVDGVDKRILAQWTIVSMIDEVVTDPLLSGILKNTIPDIIERLWRAGKDGIFQGDMTKFPPKRKGGIFSALLQLGRSCLGTS